MLKKIVEKKKEEIKMRKQVKPNFENLKKSTKNFKFTLRGKSKLSLISELKKASPTKGIIDEEFQYLTIAKEYEQAGASCISVLTDETFFHGSLKIMREVSREVPLPILRKDFILDPYQVYEARSHGADAVLLIVKALNLPTLKACQQVALDLNMDVLVEVHTEEELKIALSLNEENLMLGINNRNLDDLKVDMQTVINLAEKVPTDHVLVAESGYKTIEDLEALRGKVDAVLIGSSIIQATDRIGKIKSLLNPILV